MINAPSIKWPVVAPLSHLVGAPHHAPGVAALLPGVAQPGLLVQDGVVEGVGLLLEIKLINTNPPLCKYVEGYNSYLWA